MRPSLTTDSPCSMSLPMDPYSLFNAAPEVRSVFGFVFTLHLVDRLLMSIKSVFHILSSLIMKRERFTVCFSTYDYRIDGKGRLQSPFTCWLEY
jgi:hypothetical protein